MPAPRYSRLTATIAVWPLFTMSGASAEIGPAIIGSRDVSTTSTTFVAPTALALDSTSGKLIDADEGASLTRGVAQHSASTIIAGDGSSPETADKSLEGVAVARDRSIFVADTGNDVIRKAFQNVITTVAGRRGVSGSADGATLQGSFSHPRDFRLSADGALS